MSDNEFDKFRLFLLGLGHFTVDVYANLLPPLLPLFKQTYDLSYAATAGLTSIFAVTSTLIQPVFGFIADRYGKNWIAALGIAWISVLIVLITGAISDHFGIFNGILSLILIAMVAAFLSLAVPGDKTLKTQRERRFWGAP